MAGLTGKKVYFWTFGSMETNVDAIATHGWMENLCTFTLKRLLNWSSRGIQRSRVSGPSVSTQTTRRVTAVLCSGKKPRGTQCPGLPHDHTTIMATTRPDKNIMCCRAASAGLICQRTARSSASQPRCSTSEAGKSIPDVLQVVARWCSPSCLLAWGPFQ